MTAGPRDVDDRIGQRIRRVFRDLRTEGGGRGREAAAIGVGAFLGCLPFYGFHWLLCWLFGFVFRLNRLKVYLAANVSNPFVAPWLVLAELQTGSWIRHGTFQALSVSGIRAKGLGVVGVDLLAGSVAVGLVVAGLAALGTYLLVRAPSDDATFVELVRRASDRYIERSITAWEFARGKLRGDPIYRTVTVEGLLPSGGVLLDVGCGQGLMLALLSEARRAANEGLWPASWSPVPLFERLIGVEVRPRVAAAARSALGADAEIMEQDARVYQPPTARAVLLFDVLHLLPRADQDVLLGSLAAALDADGVMLIREADPAGGWRFHGVWIGNAVKSLVMNGRWARFSFRTREEWLDCFSRHGLHADVRPMGTASFANVLFVLRAAGAAAASSRQREPPA